MENEAELELRRVKDDLEDLEMYLQEFNAFLPLAVCTVNPIQVLINVNAAFESVTGYSAHEGVGKNLSDLFLEGETIKNFLDNLQQGEKFAESTEVTLVLKSGEHRTVNLTASTRSDRSGQFTGFFIGINDVTELKSLQTELEREVARQTEDLEIRAKELESSRAEIIEALSEVEEERYKTSTLVTNLTDGLVYIDIYGTLEMINPRAENMLGLWGGNAGVVGGNFFEIELTERADKLRSLLSQGVHLEREVIEFTDDSVVEVSTVDIMNEEGGKVGTLAILHDISKERVLDNLKVEFISVAAHQMRTPLAAIKWAFELLLASDDEKLAPELKKVAESGFDSTHRILKIINNFLEVDAMESADFNYIFAPVNITKVVEDIFSEVEIEARERGVKLVFLNENEHLPYVRADQGRLSNIFQNLIENALKYTIGEGTITVQTEVRDQEMLISVKDEGIGIPEAEINNIFTRFFRAKNAKKVETDGNGLGLYTTKKMVERHGGSIWFESVEGGGSTFFFTMPLYK